MQGQKYISVLQLSRLVTLSEVHKGAGGHVLGFFIITEALHVLAFVVVVVARFFPFVWLVGTLLIIIRGICAPLSNERSGGPSVCVCVRSGPCYAGGGLTYVVDVGGAISIGVGCNGDEKSVVGHSTLTLPLLTHQMHCHLPGLYLNFEIPPAAMFWTRARKGRQNRRQ